MNTYVYTLVCIRSNFGSWHHCVPQGEFGQPFLHHKHVYTIRGPLGDYDRHALGGYICVLAVAMIIYTTIAGMYYGIYIYIH